MLGKEGDPSFTPAMKMQPQGHCMVTRYVQIISDSLLYLYYLTEFHESKRSSHSFRNLFYLSWHYGVSVKLRATAKPPLPDLSDLTVGAALQPPAVPLSYRR
jgi:hypothetical protein